MAVTSQSPSSGYAGDLGVEDAWKLLVSDQKAQLIDVRTTAEWSYVGLPDLSKLNRTTHCIEWQTFPSSALNDQFVAEAVASLRNAGAGNETPVLLLCRSGVRSRAAAIALTRAGFSNAFNIAGGFEGDLDAEKHRGQRNGWKAAGLPWRQT